MIRARLAVLKVFWAGDCSTNCLVDSFARGATTLARRVAHALSAASLLMISQMNAKRHFTVYFCLHRAKFARKHGRLASPLTTP
jgi:hypothetical protein